MPEKNFKILTKFTAGAALSPSRRGEGDGVRRCRRAKGFDRFRRAIVIEIDFAYITGRMIRMKNSFNIRQFFAGFIALLLAASCGSNKEHALFQLIPPSETGIDFTNTINENDSLNVIKDFYVYNGGGVAVADVNNDSLPDIFFTGNMASSELYINEGRMKFKKVTKDAGCTTTGWASGVCMVDINNDGLTDIYVCRAGAHAPSLRANLLFVNKGIDKNGMPHFQEEAARYGIADTGYTTQAVFFDYDKDNDLDLFLLNHSLINRNPNLITPFKNDGTGPATDELYRNDDGKFVNISHEAGILCDGMGLGVAINDFNMDGWPDIYVSNDFVSHDFLYINNHNGTFSEKGAEYFKHYSQFSMGTDAADINNDGLTDLAVVDMLPYEYERRQTMPGPMTYDQYNLLIKSGYQPQYMRNTLQVNNGINSEGKYTFSETGQYSGIAATDWSWSPLFADFDNDGLKDLFISNGYKRFVTNMDFVVYNIGSDGTVLKPPVTEAAKISSAATMPGIDVHNFIFQNKGALQFADKSNDWGFDKNSYSNGAAYTDLDNDGDLDIVVNNIDAPAFVYENKSEKNAGNHFLNIALQGPDGNANGIGAKIWLYKNDTMQYQYQSMVRGYQSYADSRIHFGLGNSNTADSLIVLWPDGKFQKLVNIPTNQFLKINYADAKDSGYISPNTSIPSNTLLQDITKNTGIDYINNDKPFPDFNFQYLLPHKLSEQGPKLAAGDVNSDGLDDFFAGGSTGQNGQIFIQNKNGTFTKGAAVVKDPSMEDVSAVFFDADNDKDEDLYVVSGSNEFPNPSAYQDRLYINNGKGEFVLNKDALPQTRYSGSCIAAADFDGDGDIDLFRGGRLVPLRYPLPASSFLLENNGGKFIDVTKTKAPEFEKTGMVTSAAWADFNNDKKMDIVVAGEFMAPQFFKNENGKFVNITASTGLASAAGWWNCIKAVDTDEDGDMDFIAGNLGLNGRYKVSEKEPLTMYAEDFNHDGTIDPVMTYYLQGEEHFVAMRDQFIEQMRGAYSMFPTYKKFAAAKVHDVFSPEAFKNALTLKTTTFESCIFENNGNGKFIFKPLPAEAQLAPIMDILAEDINNDKHPDLILIGNDYGTEVIAGRYDAFIGALLINDGKGNFKSLPQQQSGFFADGDARSIVSINTAGGKIFIVSNHNGNIQVFIKK